MRKSITEMMVNHFNLKMESEGSCLRYVVDNEDGSLSKTYKLIVKDKYVDGLNGVIPSVTEEFETMVRDFFRGYGVDNTGFSNTVATIVQYNI